MTNTGRRHQSDSCRQNVFERAASPIAAAAFSKNASSAWAAFSSNTRRRKLLFDTGFGRNVDAHFKMTPWLMQNTARFEQEPTAAEQLAAAGIALDRHRAYPRALGSRQRS